MKWCKEKDIDCFHSYIVKSLLSVYPDYGIIIWNKSNQITNMLILEEKNCVRIVFRKKNRVMQGNI